MRRGVLYRLTVLDRRAGAGLEVCAKRGIRAVYGLRAEVKPTAQPDRVSEGTEVIACDVVADVTAAAAAQVLKALPDPNQAEAVFGSGTAAARSERGYPNPSAQAACRCPPGARGCMR